ncbi:MAG: zf-HC2 domain-containing protein [Actinomycetota bacterium]
MKIGNPFRADCHEAARLMSELADGQLRGLRRWRVARHVLMCEICAPIYRGLLATIESVRSLAADRPPPSPSFVDDVVTRIRDDQDPGRG